MQLPLVAGRTEMAVAATAPVSSAGPIAVAHTPTTTSAAVPVRSAWYVVAPVVVTVTVWVVPAVAVAVPLARARTVSCTVIVAPLTAVT